MPRPHPASAPAHAPSCQGPRPKLLPRFLHLHGSCSNVKIRFMGEQLKAKRSFLAPQAAEYAPILASDVRYLAVWINLLAVYGCVSVWARARTHTVCVFEMWSLPPPQNETMKALMRLEYLCLSNLGDRLLKVSPKQITKYGMPHRVFISLIAELSFKTLSKEES